MKLRELERHLRMQGYIFFREGGAHTVWLNPPTGSSPAYGGTAKSRKEPLMAFASNWKSPGPDLKLNCWIGQAIGGRLSGNEEP